MYKDKDTHTSHTWMHNQAQKYIESRNADMQTHIDNVHTSPKALDPATTQVDLEAKPMAIVSTAVAGRGRAGDASDSPGAGPDVDEDEKRAAQSRVLAIPAMRLLVMKAKQLLEKADRQLKIDVKAITASEAEDVGATPDLLLPRLLNETLIAE